MRPPTAQAATARVLLATLLVLSGSLAGCFGADAKPDNDPLSLIQAVRLGTPAAHALAPTGKLVGFEGHEGPAPQHLRGLVSTYKVNEDTRYDSEKADGRVYHWALLFATYQGGLIRVQVDANPRQIEATWLVEAGDAQLRYLWGLNMGGRLLHDSTGAIQTLRNEDAAIHRYLRETPDASVVYVSEIVPSDVTGNDDMAYRMDIGYGASRDAAYAYYGLVGHFSGKVIASGDFERGEELRTVNLVDEEFELGISQQEGSGSLGLPVRAYDARLALAISGNGRYTFQLYHENKTLLARYVGNVLREDVSYTKDLGDLEPGGYTMRVEAVGLVAFRVVVDAVVVV